MPRLGISLLGSFRTTLDGEPITRFRGDTVRALLAYLATHAGTAFRQEARYPYVANSRWFEDIAAREIDALAATLPPEVAAAAQERGQARDLWATVEELLTELEG